MLWNPNDRDSDGYTALHIACKANNLDLVKLMLSVAHSDPNVMSKNEKMPLQLTSDLRTMKILVEHGAKMPADVTFKLITNYAMDSIASKIFKLSAQKGTMLWSPDDLNRDGYTALHLACKADNLAFVKLLLYVAHCDPNVKSSYSEEAPLQLTSDLRIMKSLVQHDAKMTTDVVFKVISSKYASDPRASEILKLSINKGTMLWNPNDLNCDGYTALHLLCKDDNETMVNLLLSVAHCDPNVKSNREEVPLQMTTNTEIIKDLIRHGAKTSIMYASHQNPLRTSKPVQPPVKVFIVGNPSVGKSTLTAAL